MDISGFGAVLAAIWNGFDTPLNIYGFTFSLRDVFMFGIISSMIFGAIGWLLFDN